MKKLASKSLKEHRIGIILKKIISGKNITRIRISRETGLPKSTVSDLVKYLISRGVVIESKKGISKLGKKPIVLKLNEEFQFILALDIGQVNLTAVIANLKGEIFFKLEYEDYPKNNRRQIVNSINSIINELQKKSKDIFKKINLFSLGTHGVVNPNTGIITKAPYLKNWSGVNIVKILENRYKKKVILNNSNNLGAIGEQWKAYKDIRNLIYIDIESGIGAGIILNNQIITGDKGTMGELSYMPILKQFDMERLKQNKFELGLFESQVDINGIVRTVKKRLVDSNNDLVGIIDNPEDIDFKMVCKYYRLDYPNIIKEIINDEIINILAIGIASMLSIIDTELVIINGDILCLGQGFIKNLKKRLFSMMPFKCNIVSSKLKKEAHISGALKNGIDHINNLFYNNPFSIIN